MPAAPEPRRRRRRKVAATGSVRVVWRAKGPMWLISYRLPDGTESQTTLGAAWVKRDPADAKGWLPRRGRPPGSALSEDAARGARRAACLPGPADGADPARARHGRPLRRRLPRRLRGEGPLAEHDADVPADRGRGQGTLGGLADRRRRLRRAGGLPRRTRRARPARLDAQPAPRGAVRHLPPRSPRLSGQCRPDGRL